jgi:hypothetical protein
MVQVWISQFIVKHVECANNMGIYMDSCFERTFLYCGVYKIKHGTLSQYYHDNKVRELGHKSSLNLEGKQGHIITN